MLTLPAHASLTRTSACMHACSQISAAVQEFQLCIISVRQDGEVPGTQDQDVKGVDRSVFYLQCSLEGTPVRWRRNWGNCVEKVCT